MRTQEGMKGGMRNILLVILGGILLLLVLETGIYNWRLILAMRQRNLSEMHLQLCWHRDELLVERAVLLNPKRLQSVGTSLGMGPVPLDRVAVLKPREGEDGLNVCMGQ